MARTSKLFGDKTYKRSARDVAEERDAGYGELHDYWHGHHVSMRWSNFQGPYEDDMIFLLKVRANGKPIEVAISKEELLRFLRYV